MNRARVVIVAVAIALVAGATAGVARTRASWTDETYFQAQASAGTWDTGPESLWQCKSIEPSLPDARCWVEPFASPAVWYVSQNHYGVPFNVVTDSETPFRWEVSLNLRTQYLWNGSPILSTGGTPGVSMFPPDAVPGSPSWLPANYQLVSTCAASPGSSLPDATIHGIGTSQYESAYVVASRPWQTQNLQIQAYAAGTGGSTWGTGQAPTCAAVQALYDSAIVCYRAAAPQEAECQADVTNWQSGNRQVEWTVSAPPTAATPHPYVWEVRFDLSKTSAGGPFAGIPSGFNVWNACVVWPDGQTPETYLPVVKLRGIGLTQLVAPGGPPVGTMGLSDGALALSHPSLRCPNVGAHDLVPALSCVALDSSGNPQGGASCGVSVMSSGGNPPFYLERTLGVTTTPPSPSWRLELNLSHSSWPFLVNQLGHHSGTLTPVSVPPCGDIPRLVVVDGVGSSVVIQGWPSGQGAPLLLNCPP